jgi:hypothetical protein
MWKEFDKDFSKCTIVKAHESFSKMCSIIRFEFAMLNLCIRYRHLQELKKSRYFEDILNIQPFMEQLKPPKLDKKPKSKTGLN